MKELFRTNNVVYLSYAQAVLKDAGIETLVFDGHMSIVEGSLGVLPRRLMVVNDDETAARRLLANADPPEVGADQPEVGANPPEFEGDP
jgi:hypothetical protein